MALEQKQKDYNWYYTSVTFEPDGSHTHVDACWKDFPYTITTREMFSGAVEKVEEKVDRRAVCGLGELKWLRFVTFAATPDEAKTLAQQYAQERMPQGYQLYSKTDHRTAGGNVNLYQKNYIRESRLLVKAGQFAGIKPFGV